MPHSSLNSNPLPGTANPRVPIVNSTSITGPGDPPNTAHFRCPLKHQPLWLQEHTELVSWMIKQSKKLSFRVIPNLAGQAMSNDNGVWVNPLGFVISSIIPFIEGPEVINKQNSEWWSNYTTGRDGRLQHWWLRGTQWLPCSDAASTYYAEGVMGEEAGGGVKGALNSEAV